MPTRPSGSSARTAPSPAVHLSEQVDVSPGSDHRPVVPRRNHTMPKPRLATVRTAAPSNRERLCRVFNLNYDPEA